jgi:hypothetical protein
MIMLLVVIKLVYTLNICQINKDFWTSIQNQFRYKNADINLNLLMGGAVAMIFI